MKSFSQRKGLKPVKNVMQIHDMDQDLRIGLWNALTTSYWETASGGYLSGTMERLFRTLWHEYFKEPIDTLSPIF